MTKQATIETDRGTLEAELFEKDAPKSFHVEPGGLVPRVHRDGAASVVEMPPLAVHAMLIGEY